MKRIIKKQISIMILILIILSTVSYATTDTTKSPLIEKTEQFSQWEQLSETERKSVFQPSYFNVDIKESIKRSTYNQYVGTSSTLGESYILDKDDIEDDNIIIKNQMKTGSCWAFSYTTVIETTMANKYNRPLLEYSPMHMEYVASSLYNKGLGEGGNIMMSLAYGASGYGPVYEQDLSFESVYDEQNNDSLQYYLTDMSEVELNQVQRARIEDAVMFAPIYKEYETDSIVYKDSNSILGATEYTEEDVNAERQLIKKHIIENGALTAYMHSDIEISNGNIQSEYYNPEKNAYYCNGGYFDIANHAVTIIGWDDTFKKENFLTQPLNDGAYIVLSSWGSEFGNNGYFYISYDDSVIEQAIVGVTNITEKISEEEVFYDNIYEYDQLGMNYGISPVNEEMTEYLSTGYSANVFERKNSEQIEYLSEIGIFLMNAEGINIYVNEQDDNIDKCTLVGTYTGENALEAGYHTLELASPVQLVGEEFVVKIEYINDEQVIIPIECNLSDSGLTTVSNDIYDTAVSNENESFISFDGTEWNDLYNYTIDSYTLKNTNACIKAFTTISEGEPTVVVEGVQLDRSEVTIENGETITLTATVSPENATNKNVIWTSDNESIATVVDGFITGMEEGTATITVTTEDGSFTDTCLVIVENLETGEDIWDNWEDQNQENTGDQTTNDNTTTETTTKPSTVAVTGIILDEETVTIKKGETSELLAIILPQNATNQNITWTSDDESIAIVIDGVIVGVSEGTTTITATTEDGNYTDSCVVTVEPQESEQEPEENPEENPEQEPEQNPEQEPEQNPEEKTETIEVTGVTLDKETVTIKMGQVSNLEATILPEDATNQNIIWTSDNENVATVVDGVVIGISEGTATITATTEIGNFSDTCIVTVENIEENIPDINVEQETVKVTGVELNKESLNMQVGEKTNLVATIKPTNATNKNVTWKSSNENVATISETGIIEAIKVGTTTITVTTKDGSYTASCELTISQKTSSPDDIYIENDKQPGNIEQATDSTIAKEEIPKAGATIIMTIVLVSVIIMVIIYKKYKKYEDIH